MDEITTIRLTKKTKTRLDEIGKKSETHDDIVNKLLDSYEKDLLENNERNSEKRKKNGKV